MCGIFGIMNLTNDKPVDADRFARALATLNHRGPDARRQEWFTEGLMLGHTRLSIIDLTEDSNQPLSIGERYWIVYNGEIFNYLELREELEALGARFRTSGDVEVLLRAYAEWGEDCVGRLNGMWGFAIYDRQEHTLFCSRDRFGEKPFSYAEYDGRFFFASEIKAMVDYEPGLVEPDYNVIANFCRTSVGAQHEQSWFKNVKRLPPGCNMTIRNGKRRIERYWYYPEETDTHISFDEAKSQFAELFRDAVKIRMRSDVPLGVTLSAGVDSNAIAHNMQAIDPAPHYCFTARFHPDEKLVQDASIYVDANREIDESVSARKVAKALGLHSKVVETDYGDIVGDLQRIVYHLDSGNSAPAVLPLMQLLREARKFVTVILDGQGADELLAGYIVTLFWPLLFDEIKAGRLSLAWDTFRQFSETYTISHSALMAIRALSNRFPAISTVRQKAQGIDRIYGSHLREFDHMPDFPDVPGAADGGFVARQLRRQHSGGLVNLLHYGDAISMANSIESRMPFLDYRLVEFVWKLPPSHKIKLGVGKRILREGMRGLVPDEILDNRVKYGFTTPIGEQFRKHYADGKGPIDILLSERCIDRKLFDRQGLESLIDEHRSARSDHGPLLFRLLSTELWFRTFVDGETPQRMAA